MTSFEFCMPVVVSYIRSNVNHLGAEEFGCWTWMPVWCSGLNWWIDKMQCSENVTWGYVQSAWTSVRWNGCCTVRSCLLVGYWIHLVVKSNCKARSRRTELEERHKYEKNWFLRWTIQLRKVLMFGSVKMRSKGENHGFGSFRHFVFRLIVEYFKRSKNKRNQNKT